MKNFDKIFEVIEYTDEDLKDTDKYNEYTKTISELMDLIEETPIVRSLMDQWLDNDLLDDLDDLLLHADEVYSESQKAAKEATKDALETPCKCVCKCTSKAPVKHTVEDLVNEYLKQSEIQKSFTKPVHYYQAYHLLSDFAEFVLNK